ncbi:MAG: hypothetical protein HND56_05950 [Pseudomonadota bacterium]|nr:hypothetical protein [Pseudomonadota bacterium]QKK05256.1 MAG: hypothetical protein HND56_05950 [Pseudomonadota bacterium]
MADSKSILQDLFKDMGQAMIDGQRIAQRAEQEFIEHARGNKATEEKWEDGAVSEEKIKAGKTSAKASKGTSQKR